jgi:diguanylate cyclase (GGDEF)-like protein
MDITAGAAQAGSAADTAAGEDTGALGAVIGRSPSVLGAGAALLYFLGFAAMALLAFAIVVDNSERRAQAAMAELARAMASQVDAGRHERLRGDADTDSPDYLALVTPLARQHAALDGVRNVYTMRLAPGGLVYVLDTARVASVRSRATSVARVGHPVPTDSMDPAMAGTVMRGEVFVDQQVYQEGNVSLRGVYAPIRDADGAVRAILGADYEERQYTRLTWGESLRVLLVAMALLGVVSVLVGSVVYLLRDRLGRILEERRLESIRDGLTGLYNRGFFNRRLERHVALARRGGHPLSLLVFDADLFKRINDTWGHPAGDRVLEMIADQARRCTRAADLACRIGGEEFAIIMPDTATAEAEAVFRRLADGIRQPLRLGETEQVVTVSAGIATLDAGTADADALLSRADQALYGAKAGGRDWCVVAPPAVRGA